MKIYLEQLKGQQRRQQSNKNKIIKTKCTSYTVSCDRSERKEGRTEIKMYLKNEEINIFIKKPNEIINA